MSNDANPPLTPQEQKAVAEFYADVGAHHIAAIYAQALLAATEKAGQTDAVLEEFDALVSEILDRFPNVESVLRSSFVSDDDKAGIIDRSLGGRASPLLVNFLKVLARHGRMELVRLVQRETHRELDRLRGRQAVELVTATEIDDATARRLVATIAGALAGQAVLQRRVDPSLIGGAVVKIGDKVYDGSVATQLAKLREKIIDRSVHEIQSRRDRIRSSAGN